MSSIFDSSEYASGAEEVLQALDANEESAENSESEAQETLSEVVSRIEEANLWKHLIANDVFEQGSAKTAILASANQKVKKFATKQAQLLLGIGQPEVKANSDFTKQQLEVLEVFAGLDREQTQALVILANKMLKRDIKSNIAEMISEPKLKTVSTSNTTKESSVVTAKIQTSPVKAKVAQQQPSPEGQQKEAVQQPAKKSPLKHNPTAKPFATPSGKRKPVPMARSPEELMNKGAIKAAPPVMGGDAVSQAAGNAMMNVIQSLTNGNVVSNLPMSKSDFDPNESM